MALAYVARSKRPGRKRRPASVTVADWCGPTPERLRHARAAGQLAVVESYETDAGEQTQLKRRRFISPLEGLWKVGELTADQFGAARRYARDADLAAVLGPGQSVKYEPRMIEDAGAAFLLPIERAAEYLIRLARAQEACGAHQMRMLNWISVEPIGWRAQAAIWFRGFSEVGREQKFKGLLRGTCDKLAAHYEWSRRSAMMERRYLPG